MESPQDDPAKSPEVLKFTKDVFAHLKKIGIPDGAFSRLIAQDDTDWSFIIKLHAAMEASISRLIVLKLGDDRLTDVISRLEMSDQKKGKLAFVKALELLPDDHRTFIKVLSEIRNSFAHNIKNLDSKITDHVAGMPEGSRKAFRKAILQLVRIEGEPRPQPWVDLIENDPRNALMLGCCMVLFSIENASQLLSLKPPESNPKG